jgi:hypothetical protein
LHFGRQFVIGILRRTHIAQDQSIRAQVSARKVAIEG